MKRAWYSLALLIALPSLSFAVSGQEGSSAAFRVLDKQTNRINRFVVDRGNPAAQVPFKLVAVRCVKNVGGVPGQDAAWIEASAKDGKDGADALFSGWMFNTYPDVATFDHPRYDVQLVGCDTTAEDKAPTILPEIKVEEEPVRDDEAPAAAQPAGQGDEAPTSGTGATNADGSPDPYFVPGMENTNSAQTVVTQEPVDNSIPAEDPTPAQKEEQDNELHRMIDGM